MNAIPKQPRRRISDEQLALMWSDFQRLGSISAAAQQHGRRCATLWRLFVDRGLLQPRPRRLPAELVDAMYAEYLAGLSLEQVGEKFGRTRQSIFELFKKRRLKLRAKEFLPAIEYGGRKFTCQKTCGQHRYLRDTAVRTNKTRYLHHLVWEEHHGPIPRGHKVAFRDGNHLNVSIDNLELLTNSEQVRKYASKGMNGAKKTAPARLSALLARHGTGSVSAQLKRRARA